MIYRCSNCDSALEFDPVSGMMQCLRCGSFFETSELEAEEPEEAEGEYNPEVEAFEDASTMEVKIYTCSACGAELAVNDTEVSTWCAYCGQPSVVYSRVSKEKKPKYIIPFRITRDEVLHTIREMFRKGILTPKAVKEFEVEKLRGIYIPYYLFDAYYHDREEVFADNKMFNVEAECEFNRVYIDASKRLEDESTQRLEPFELGDLRTFEPAYLSGFYADRNDLSARQLNSALKKRCKELFDSQLRGVLHSQNPYVNNSNPDLEVRNADYALFPIWFMTFRHANRPYTILVNGQTGKMVGGVPMHKGKLWAMYLGISFVASTLLTAGSFWLYSMIGEGIGAFVAVIVLALILHAVGLSFITTYHKNVKLTRLSLTAKFVRERQEEE